MIIVRRRDISSVLIVVSLLLIAMPGGAQRPGGTQLGVRVDAIGSRATTLQAGVSANALAGLYIRLEGTIAGGSAWHDGAHYGAFRTDATARFALDPFRENKHAFYGLGGLSLLYDGLEKWRPRLLTGFGVEGPVRRRRVFAIELALGGGVRLGLVMRSARASGR